MNEPNTKAKPIVDTQVDVFALHFAARMNIGNKVNG
jgi:hypothetical protein